MEKKQRLVSLDFFRGLTVAMMCLVNNPGDWGHIYAPLEHSAWHGCTPTDLVFPFFLFIVGVSIVFAMESKKKDPANHSGLLANAARRALILFAIGLFLSLFPKFDFGTVRIPGVIQRISLVFFVCTLIYLKTERKTWLWIFGGLLVFYWLAMTLIPVPGVGYANLEAETNLGAWIDRTILTEPHLWKSAKTWDPEGLFSTIPAFATGIFGILTGTWLKRKDIDEATRVSWMFAFGVLAIIAGLVWDLFFPINKQLWTSSFVLYAGGLALTGLSLCYWLIDVQGYRRFTWIFVVFGANAITVFTLSGLIPRLLNMIRISWQGEEVGAQFFLYQKFFVPYFHRSTPHSPAASPTCSSGS